MSNFKYGAMIGGALLVLFGVPVLLVAFGLMSGLVKPDCPAPSPVPTASMPIVPVVVNDAVTRYVGANWQGWNFRGYDPERLYDWNNEFDCTIWLERDGHTQSVDLRVISLVDGPERYWEAIPVTSD